MTAYKKGVPLALTQVQEAPPLESLEADHENDSDFGGDFEADEEYKWMRQLCPLGDPGHVHSQNSSLPRRPVPRCTYIKNLLYSYTVDP